MDTLMEQQPLLDNSVPSWKRLLNVEPAMFFYSTAFTMSQVTLQNMLLRADCEEWNFANGTCVSELQSQVQSSQENSASQTISILMAIVTTMIAGTLVDRNLKYLRWFIILPLVGQFLGDFLNILNLLLFHFNGITIALYTAFIPGLFGIPVTFPIICSSYIAHTSTKKERTIKMSYMYFSFTVGVAVATYIAGYVIKYFGFLQSYALCIAFEICAIILVFVFVESKDFEYSKVKAQTFLSSLLKGDVEILKKKRPQSKRAIINMLFIIYGIIHAYPVGEATVLYLYTRNQFNWDSVYYGTYVLLKQLMKCLGAILGAEILKRRFKLHDATVGIICAVLEISMGLSWFIVREEWQIYTALFFGSSEKIIYSVSYSLASKCVETSEYGRLSSIYGSSLVLIPIAILWYNGLYEITITSNPQAIFFVSASCSFIMLVFFSYIWYLTRKKPLYVVKNSS